MEDFFNENNKLSFICQSKGIRKYYANVLTRLEKFNTLFSSIFKDNRKRSALTFEASQVCTFLESLWRKIGELKDGPVFSIQKMMVSSILDNDWLELLEDYMENSRGLRISQCWIEEKYAKIIEHGFQELKDFYEIKEFDDGIGEWKFQNNYDLCVSPLSTEHAQSDSGTIKKIILYC